MSRYSDGTYQDLGPSPPGLETLVLEGALAHVPILAARVQVQVRVAAPPTDERAQNVQDALLQRRPTKRVCQRPAEKSGDIFITAVLACLAELRGPRCGTSSAKGAQDRPFRSAQVASGYGVLMGGGQCM